MGKRLWKFYVASFAGLGLPSWFLAVIAFVNRAGTMVVPFLSLYLVESLGIRAQDVSWILMAFGLGSIGGSMVGGKLVQRWGSIRVLAISLVSCGLAFVAVLEIQSYTGILVGVFAIGLVGDAFRPAAMVAITETVDALLRKRALALLRMAVNAGMAIGPAVGGWLATMNYKWLFIGDAAACWFAALILLWGNKRILRRCSRPKGEPGNCSKESPCTRGSVNSAARTSDVSSLMSHESGDELGHNLSNNKTLPEVHSHVVKTAVQGEISSQKNWLLWMILTITFLTGVCFFQVVATKPLFLHKFYGLSEASIGTIFSINGGIIVPLEMMLFHAFEARNPLRIYALGNVLIGLAFVILPVGTEIGFAWVTLSVLLWTFGEMLTIPFANAIVLNIAPEGKIGLYMGWYSATFSAAFLVAPVAGLQLYAYMGWTNLWLCVGIVSTIVAGTSVLLSQKIAQNH